MFKKALIVLSIFFIGSKIESSDSVVNFEYCKVTPFSYQQDLRNKRSEQDIFDLIIPGCIEVPKEEIPGGNVVVDNCQLCFSCGFSIGICLCNYYLTDSFLIPTAQSVNSIFLAYLIAAKDDTNKTPPSCSEILRNTVGLIGISLCTYCATDSCVIAAAQPVISMGTASFMSLGIPSVLALAGSVPAQRVPQEDPKKME